MISLRRAAGLTALATLLVVAPAGAAGPARFAPAQRVALPSGSKGLTNGYLPTLVCPAVGDCVGAGAYNGANGDVKGLVITETDGVWRAPLTLAAPAGAAANAGTTIDGLSCAAVGSCALGGSYYDAAGNEWPLVDVDAHGAWQRASELELPANALGDGQTSEVRSVACAAVGTCVAVGTYLDDTTPVARTVGFVAEETGGAWHAATESTLPAGANADPFVSLNQVACPEAGSCVAVGSFIGASDVTEGLVLQQSGTTWTAEVVTPPSDASAYAGTTIAEVTCLAHGACTVLGTYNAAGGGLEALVDTESSGTWPPATAVKMPANTAANPHAFLYGFLGVACASAGNCALGGQYRDAAGDYEGFLANEVRGTWHAALEAPLPADGASAGQNGGIVSLACPAAGQCRAGAAYLDTAGTYQALVLSESDGVWARGTKVVLPGGARTVGQDGGVYAMACPRPSACTAVGSYETSASNYEGFTTAN